MAPKPLRSRGATVVRRRTFITKDRKLWRVRVSLAGRRCDRRFAVHGDAVRVSNLSTWRQLLVVLRLAILNHLSTATSARVPGAIPGHGHDTCCGRPAAPKGNKYWLNTYRLEENDVPWCPGTMWGLPSDALGCILWPPCFHGVGRAGIACQVFRPDTGSTSRARPLLPSTCCCGAGFA